MHEDRFIPRPQCEAIRLLGCWQLRNRASGEIGGDWERLLQVVRVGVFVQCDDDFTEQAEVANGASELLGHALGEIGRHARSAVGVNTLPLGASVEVEFLFEIR